MNRRAPIALLAALLVASTSGIVAARKPPPPASDAKLTAEAWQRYRGGMARFNIDDYDGAIKEFQAAYLLVQDASFLYNIAQAYRKSDRPQKALDYYRRYLRGSPPPPNRVEVEVLVAQLEATLGAQAVASAAAVAAPVAPPARPLPTPLPLVEKETQTGFLSHITSDGKVYTLVGLGARKVYGFRVYGMGLYLDDEAARPGIGSLAKRAGGGDVAHLTADDLGQNFILLGEFGKLGLLKFVRAVSGADVRSSYREALADSLKSPPPALKADIEKFVALFKGDVKVGDECTIRTGADGAISVEIGGQRGVGPTNPQLAQAIWSIWLGQRPISADLRKALVNRIDTLAK
ncbi:MAG: hypothetical protein EXR72_11155 [Myxococcales bacterium]|nr:hypothetical protein [Myxococcales bacterium]